MFINEQPERLQKPKGLTTFLLHDRVCAQNRIELWHNAEPQNALFRQSDIQNVPRGLLHANGLMTLSPEWGVSFRRTGKWDFLFHVWHELKPPSGPSKFQSPAALRNNSAI